MKKEINLKQYMSIIKKIPIFCVDAIIQKENNEYLLLKRKNNPMKGKWWVPGGRVLQCEKVTDAIKRKIHEEIGYKIKKFNHYGFFEKIFSSNSFESNIKYHTVSLVFKAKVKNNIRIKLCNQSSEWKWSRSLPRKLESNLICL